MFSLTHGLCEEPAPRLDAGVLRSLEGIVDAEGLETLRQADARSDTIDWWDYGTRRLAPFSRGERAAIIRYLEYRSSGDFDAPEVSQALDRYWRPSLREPVG